MEAAAGAEISLHLSEISQKSHSHSHSHRSVVSHSTSNSHSSTSTQTALNGIVWTIPFLVFAKMPSFHTFRSVRSGSAADLPAGLLNNRFSWIMDSNGAPQLLGQGSFGRVYKMLDTNSRGTLIAMKMIRAVSAEAANSGLSEVRRIHRSCKIRRLDLI